MKKWILSIAVILVLVLVAVVLIFGNKETETTNKEMLIADKETIIEEKESTIENNDDILKPILQIDGDKVKGEVKSLIIQFEDNIFFFGDNGKCVKKVDNKDLYNQFAISKNGAYCALTTSNREDSYSSLSLFDCNGSLIWEKEFDYFISPYAIANDGKRVLAKLIYDEGEENENVTFKYLNEEGNELVSFDVMTENHEFSISDNCRYWTYLDLNTKMCQFYHDDKKIREEKMLDGSIRIIGDNGNYVIGFKKPTLYTFSGEKNSKYDDINVFYLSRDGKMVLKVKSGLYTFENINGERQVINKKDIQSHTDNRVHIFDMDYNFSSDGSYFVVDLEPRIEHLMCFIFKDGRIVTTKVDLGKSEEEYPLSHEIFSERNIMAVYNYELKKCILYEVDGRK